MLRIAFTSLSAVPTRNVDSNKRSATNCSCGGITIFVPRRAIIILRSSTKVEISINAFSNEVSLRSAAVARRLLWLPDKLGCAFEHSAAPSPIAEAPAVNALFRIAAALICLVCRRPGSRSAPSPLTLAMRAGGAWLKRCCHRTVTPSAWRRSGLIWSDSQTPLGSTLITRGMSAPIAIG